MQRRISLRLAIAAILAAAVLPLTALAQSQDPPAQSVADAARRAREKKKAADKQPAPVITDDTLRRSAPAPQEANAPAPAPAPSSEAAPASTPAPAAQPAADSSSAADATAAPAPAGQSAPAANTDQKAKDSAELAALKQQVAEAQKGLELLQREFALQQDSYISNPDHSHDLAGKAKLDAMLQQVTDKQQAVNALKSQLAALQASSGSTAPAAPTAPPQI
jgi:hypothetical protein